VAVTRALLDRGAKAVVVACNTATGAAVDRAAPDVLAADRGVSSRP
jgi:glutamate racemase